MKFAISAGSNFTISNGRMEILRHFRVHLFAHVRLVEPNEHGEVQISLDFVTGQRSIVTLRLVQATQ